MTPPHKDLLPNNINSGIYGLDTSLELANVVIIPVPWDVTVSYRDGTSAGPSAVIKASPQLDLFDPLYQDKPTTSIYALPISMEWEAQNQAYRPKASDIIQKLEAGTPLTPQDHRTYADINTACKTLHDDIHATATHWIAQGKTVGLLGGDHSTSLGNIRAVADRYPQLGILQIDAHMDLRCAYEGFTYSHASIMYNVLQDTSVKKIVQVGIRDYCEFEYDILKNTPKKINTFFDRDLKNRLFSGETWQDICSDIISRLPDEVYITFDIDGLTPACCPDTGTPVPGGLTYPEAVYLIQSIPKSGRKIVGFDLVEVSPGHAEINSIVGARLLYDLVKSSL